MAMDAVHEQNFFGAFEGLRLKGRFDRVEHLPDGTARVVDYKTGGKLPAHRMRRRLAAQHAETAAALGQDEAVFGALRGDDARAAAVVVEQGFGGGRVVARGVQCGDALQSGTGEVQQ